MTNNNRRYGGRLIYHARDAEGALEVVETHGVRALHFGTSPKQSAMSLDEPRRLELAYARAMLSGLLFVPRPSRVLILGLGGGTLAKFILDHYAECRVDAVERRPAVVSIARDYFGLPSDDRLAVHVGEATDFVSRCLPKAYDLVLVDAYDHQGMDGSINAEAFFRDCAGSINGDGVLTINLWGTHAVALRTSNQLLRLCFPGRCMRLAVPNRGNVIGLGLGENFQSVTPSAYAATACALDVELGMEMSYFLRNLRVL
ncbi:hypothetical protein [Methylococcus sp. EFPC2]|uniref:spermine/spermidine synthase domain-containing protein n=1 Tax=Methylococcus sp. EFPC2 TaxID=2812648 RepID=UPI001967E739|nr:hypothetical protein [Methylococcus sp. EFPC2]QSA98021.1 hypothetical protein JWZ97_04140 [Methylococcus sp. EFPC2]